MLKLFRPSLLILGLLFMNGCLFSGDKSKDKPEVSRKIHLYSPWGSATPSIHGAFNNWGSDLMVQEEACGWFYHQFNGTNRGQFRFMRDWDNQLGSFGLGDESNFNVDVLLEENEDIYIYLTESGRPTFQVFKPLMPNCDPANVIIPEVPAPGAAQHPFPRQAQYAFGIRPSFAQWTDVQTVFEVWRSNFLIRSGDQARVDFDTPGQTVSEGIGYGMLILVYMDNAINNTRSDFDKLWNYYLNHLDNNGLMHWKIDGFNGALATGAASDSDLDVALALVMASAQWNEPAYLQSALVLIERIRLYEFNERGFLKPGDLWDAAKNPSYFSFVAFRAFAQVDAANNLFWNNAIDQHYTLLNQAAHSSTGLVANWTNETGTPINPNNGYDNTWGDFGFDAIRVPWRTAWDYLWYGEPRGAALATKISRWSNTATASNPNNLRSVYTLAGAAKGDDFPAEAAFIGAYAVATMTDPLGQAYLDIMYGSLRQPGAPKYYHTSMHVLYALLASGNMPNLLP
jgi:endo-1,4-beta-D-glucanase Y